MRVDFTSVHHLAVPNVTDFERNQYSVCTALMTSSQLALCQNRNWTFMKIRSSLWWLALFFFLNLPQVGRTILTWLWEPWVAFPDSERGKKSRQSGTLVCRNEMEVSGENHILGHGVNVFLSSTWDKLLLGSGAYPFYLQGMNCWGCNKRRL